MTFEIGDEVMYNSYCEYEHNEWLYPKKSIGKVITTDSDMFSEHGGAIQVRWTRDNGDKNFSWWVSAESIKLVSKEELGKYGSVIRKMNSINERRKEKGYAY